MANRRFEMFEYRRVLVRMRQGDSDRAIAKARLMGRRRAGELRQLAAARGWLDKGRGLPEDAVLAEVLGRARGAVSAGNSSVEAFREQVLAWREAGIPRRTAALPGR